MCTVVDPWDSYKIHDIESTHGRGAIYTAEVLPHKSALPGVKSHSSSTTYHAKNRTETELLCLSGQSIDR